MASLTIRNLDDEVKSALRIRAAQQGRSMEEEARDILRRAVRAAPMERDLGKEIRALFAPFGGVELPIPPRELSREPPNFE